MFRKLARRALGERCGLERRTEVLEPLVWHMEQAAAGEISGRELTNMACEAACSGNDAAGVDR